MGPVPEAVEADIAHYYPGRSVAQFWRGHMSLRELRVLVMNLPHDSATARYLRGGHSWADETFLLADIADSLRFYRVEYARAHGGHPAKPKPVNRPKISDAAGKTAPEKKEIASAVHAHVLDQVMPRREEMDPNPHVVEQAPEPIPEGGES